MLKTPGKPGGLPIEAFDEIRAGVAGDRSQFYKDLSAPFYGANRPGSTVSQGVRDAFWLMSMQAGLKGAYDCIKVFSETDLTDVARRASPAARSSQQRSSRAPRENTSGCGSGEEANDGGVGLPSNGGGTPS
jgi:hypothetical protein